MLLLGVGTPEVDGPEDSVITAHASCSMKLPGLPTFESKDHIQMVDCQVE